MSRKTINIPEEELESKETHKFTEEDMIEFGKFCRYLNK